ncbi:hypothetical protein AK812_SmicGene44631 [Symbiodinium microadriaticum]|uniref:Uncharacterized protein n=1 Tax=Symbiodinium microadriaticum TaxID=2951 RepID=A0A1Q9BXZ2_SYMMI|nr:hypothetical protein AK812_SmicGene44631 [Symbiodinium microadriaticum]
MLAAFLTDVCVVTTPARRGKRSDVVTWTSPAGVAGFLTFGTPMGHALLSRICTVHASFLPCVLPCAQTTSAHRCFPTFQRLPQAAMTGGGLQMGRRSARYCSCAVRKLLRVA